MISCVNKCFVSILMFFISFCFEFLHAFDLLLRTSFMFYMVYVILCVVVSFIVLCGFM